jgi:hypothetical protein
MSNYRVECRNISGKKIFVRNNKWKNHSLNKAIIEKMNNISNLPQVNFLLISLVFVSLVAKVVLYYWVEKEWDPVRFLHYSKSDLKMTVSKDLRNWRKKQNLLTHLFLSFILLAVFTYLFHQLIRV